MEGLPDHTEIEVIASKDGKHYKKITTIEKAREMKRKPGYTYKFFEIGFSQFKTE